MLRQSLKFKPVLACVLGLSLACSGALAKGHDDQGGRKEDKRAESRRDIRGDSHGNDRGVQRGKSEWGHHENRYHYRDGRWYSRGWFGWEFFVPALAIGAFVEALPPRHTTVIVENTTYYYDDTRYYRQLPDGVYVVVQSPRGR
ncbi:MAG: DUF6515 family protein [Candidatus Omnitrophota bacterium]